MGSHANSTSSEPSKSAADLLVGRVIDGRFRLDRIIGRGGMGWVYEAHDLQLGAPAAVKVLQTQYHSGGSDAERFLREAKLAARVQGPHVVRIIQVGRDTSGEMPLCYIAMELLRGTPLSRLMARTGGVSLGDIVEIGVQVASGLASAHEVGVLHRDVKPDNIVVHRTLGGMVTCKIIDFGIAKALEPSDSMAPLTQESQAVGTAQYMPPEQVGAQARREGWTPDARSDLYSLGMVLFAAVAGKPPFHGDDAIETLRRHRDSARPPLPAVSVSGETVPAELIELVGQLIRREPERRPQFAHRVAQFLATRCRPVALGQANPRGPIEIDTDSTLVDSPLPASEDLSLPLTRAMDVRVRPNAAQETSRSSVIPLLTDWRINRRSVRWAVLGASVGLAAVAVVWALASESVEPIPVIIAQPEPGEEDSGLGKPAGPDEPTSPPGTRTSELPPSELPPTELPPSELPPTELRAGAIALPMAAAAVPAPVAMRRGRIEDSDRAARKAPDDRIVFARVRLAVEPSNAQVHYRPALQGRKEAKWLPWSPKGAPSQERALIPGLYQIKAAARGHRTDVSSLELLPGKPLDVTISLARRVSQRKVAVVPLIEYEPEPKSNPKPKPRRKPKSNPKPDPKPEADCKPLAGRKPPAGGGIHVILPTAPVPKTKGAAQ